MSIPNNSLEIKIFFSNTQIKIHENGYHKLDKNCTGGHTLLCYMNISISIICLKCLKNIVFVSIFNHFNAID